MAVSMTNAGCLDECCPLLLLSSLPSPPSAVCVCCSPYSRRRVHNAVGRCELAAHRSYKNGPSHPLFLQRQTNADPIRMCAVMSRNVTTPLIFFLTGFAGIGSQQQQQQHDNKCLPASRAMNRGGGSDTPVCYLLIPVTNAPSLTWPEDNDGNDVREGIVPNDASELHSCCCRVSKTGTASWDGNNDG